MDSNEIVSFQVNESLQKGEPKWANYIKVIDLSFDLILFYLNNL